MRISVAFVLLLAAVTAAQSDDRPHASGTRGVEIEIAAAASPRVLLPDDVRVRIMDESTPFVFDAAICRATQCAAWSSTVHWTNPDAAGRAPTLLPLRLTLAAPSRIVLGEKGGIFLPAGEALLLTACIEAEMPVGSGRWIALDDVRQVPAMGGKVMSDVTLGFADADPDALTLLAMEEPEPPHAVCVSDHVMLVTASAIAPSAAAFLLIEPSSDADGRFPAASSDTLVIALPVGADGTILASVAATGLIPVLPGSVGDLSVTLGLLDPATGACRPASPIRLAVR